MIKNEELKRAKEIVKTLRSGEECNREKLLEELQQLEDKYKLIFY